MSGGRSGRDRKANLFSDGCGEFKELGWVGYWVL
jgi:hypothetical protein